jgi:hypothetical protein
MGWPAVLLIVSIAVAVIGGATLAMIMRAGSMRTVAVEARERARAALVRAIDEPDENERHRAAEPARQALLDAEIRLWALTRPRRIPIVDSSDRANAAWSRAERLPTPWRGQGVRDA